MDRKAEQQEQKIKQAIVNGRDRGVCDRNGNTIPKHQRNASGKGDRHRHGSSADLRRYSESTYWTIRQQRIDNGTV